ncbi:MAG TPA: DUF6268 family outer membrane beta-barrel protein [Lacibacter sp.]|nr:DUF6268 family outer membrane beta-barrel protein [Lacibacter sp.]HMO88951.1 DUF6268 family outer membrane beta-barrel protein [Lacibacter sp.]HMP88129.1 DUF6268 family outer membrane beta-barrel protein [Lacibacter sp.]
MKSFLFAAFFCTITATGIAQVTDTSGVDDMDYSQFGDAQGVKRYATQKVLNQTPNRIVSIGYEYHGGFDMPDVPLGGMLPAMQDLRMRRVGGLRAQVNIPVVSTNKVIWQLGANYMFSGYRLDGATTNAFGKRLEASGLHTAGINTTVFKPLNEKNFLILQASADLNGAFEQLSAINSKAMTYSATAIYGWKTSEKNMVGTGIARTYRAGQLIYVPVLFWNRTFNDRWGMELLLPARGHLRYNISTSNILQLGFELEGNQYWMSAPYEPVRGELFVQRGEVKPRIMWDKKLSGFFWLNLQAGLRYNYRFDAMNEYDARKDNLRWYEGKLGNPFYFNVSLNFVSP